MEYLKLADTKSKLITLGIFSTLGSAFILLIVLLYWTLFPYNPLTINTRPTRIEKNTLSKSKNEPLVYHVDVCRNTDKEAQVLRRFSDGIEYQLPEITAFYKDQGCRVYHVLLDIPQALPAGNYILVIEYHYQMNPIRDIVIKTHTENFTVIE